MRTQLAAARTVAQALAEWPPAANGCRRAPGAAASAAGWVEVAPPVIGDTGAGAAVSREPAEPPDEEALLGASPGLGADRRPTAGEVGEVGPVVSVALHHEVTVVLVV